MVRRDTEANHGRLVRVRHRIVGVEAVTVVSHEREFSRNGVGELMLNGEIVCIEPGQSHSVRTRPGENAVRQRQQPVRRNRRERPAP